MCNNCQEFPIDNCKRRGFRNLIMGLIGIPWDLLGNFWVLWGSPEGVLGDLWGPLGDLLGAS
jgi:hypothetical protein